MKYLLILILTSLCFCGCYNNTKYTKESEHNLIETNDRWKVYKVNDSCFLAIPNFNNRTDKPIILNSK